MAYSWCYCAACQQAIYCDPVSKMCSPCETECNYEMHSRPTTGCTYLCSELCGKMMNDDDTTTVTPTLVTTIAASAGTSSPDTLEVLVDLSIGLLCFVMTIIIFLVRIASKRRRIKKCWSSTCKSTKVKKICPDAEPKKSQDRTLLKAQILSKVVPCCSKMKEHVPATEKNDKGRSSTRAEHVDHSENPECPVTKDVLNKKWKHTVVRMGENRNGDQTGVYWSLPLIKRSSGEPPSDESATVRSSNFSGEHSFETLLWEEGAFCFTKIEQDNLKSKRNTTFGRLSDMIRISSNHDTSDSPEDEGPLGTIPFDQSLDIRAGAVAVCDKDSENLLEPNTSKHIQVEPGSLSIYSLGLDTFHFESDCGDSVEPPGPLSLQTQPKTHRCARQDNHAAILPDGESESETVPKCLRSSYASVVPTHERPTIHLNTNDQQQPRQTRHEDRDVSSSANNESQMEWPGPSSLLQNASLGERSIPPPAAAQGAVVPPIFYFSGDSGYSTVHV